MTCGSCAAKVEEALNSVAGIQETSVDLGRGEAQLKGKATVQELQTALDTKGNYTISELDPKINDTLVELPEVKVSTYKPLILIILFIAGVSGLAQATGDQFNGWLWMRHFMAGFFLVFAFFKFLNLKGFAESYAMYDEVAARWFSWGYVYPFVELVLGVSYLVDFEPFATNVITVVVLGVSSIGVIRSNLNRRKIKCACLGDVFNLPMSTVTIVEDLTMVGMGLIMIFSQA